MRKTLIIPLMLLFMAIFSIPACAEVNLNVNGKSYEPVQPLELEQGRTMGPLYVVGRVLGADVTVKGQDVTITKAKKVLHLTVGSTSASFNDQKVTLPCAPEIINQEIMVPLRFVYETFGAQVDWSAQEQTVAVKYSELRQGMTVEDMLAKSTAAMEKYNSYKMKINMDLQNEITDSSKPDKKEKMDMSQQMTLATQTKPLLIYAKTTSTAAIPEETSAKSAVPAESEMLINDNGMYMTLPGEGWVKFDLPGIDIKALMEQSHGQDAVASLKQMKDYGVVMSYGDDREKNGQAYWVVNVTMGPDSLSKVFGDVMKNLPVQDQSEAKDVTGSIAKAMTNMLKNMQADIVYSVWINQSNYQMSFMDLDAKMNMKISIPAQDEKTQPDSLDMNIKEKANYEVYDLGVAFTVPDVSKAVSMTEYMDKQIQTTTK